MGAAMASNNCRFQPLVSQTFSGPLTAAGVPGVSAAAMIHVGQCARLPSTGSFFTTGGSVFMTIARYELIPMEAIDLVYPARLSQQSFT